MASIEKFYCNSCGRGFDEEDAGTYSEWEGEGVYRGKISYMCCPHCGSDDYEDGEECVYCGEIFPTEEMYTDAFGDYFCRECMEELKKNGEWEDED